MTVWEMMVLQKEIERWVWREFEGSFSVLPEFPPTIQASENATAAYQQVLEEISVNYGGYHLDSVMVYWQT